jgi:hypothetical protein
MELQADFAELLELFNSRNVEYVIVGGYALAYHGAPRFTGDLDILIKPELQNAERIVAALGAFGFGSLSIDAAELIKPDQVIQLGMPPVRIDLLTSLTGASWDDIWSERIRGTYGDTPTSYIGRKQLIANKRATGRPRDLADLERLGEV